MRIAKILISALLAACVLFAAFFFYVNRREFTRAARLGDAEQVAMANARKQSQVNFARFMARLESAEEVADPEKRCLAYPDMPTSQWNPTLVKELCRVGNLPITSIDTIEKLLQGRAVAQVDQIFDDYAKKDVTDPRWRGVLLRAFVKLFQVDNARTKSIVERWVELDPKSANALTARAAFRIHQAYLMRGTSLARNTSVDSFAAMQGLLDAGAKDIDAALSITPRNKVAWALRIEAAMSSGDESAIAEAAHHALAIDPLDDTVYRIWLAAVDPRWGGLPGAMQQVVDAARPYIVQNPLLEVLDTAKQWRDSRGCCETESDVSTSPDYAALIKRAPEYRTLRDATNEATGAEGIYFSSELIRFWPEPEAYLQRAHIFQNESSRVRHASALASSDLGRAESLANDPSVNVGVLARIQAERGETESAGETYRALLRQNPRNIAALRGLIDLDIGPAKNFREAQALANQLTSAQPNVKENWQYAAATYPTDDGKFCAALKHFAQLGGWPQGVAGATKRCNDVDKWSGKSD